ncbi:MAG: aminotransferase class I/II-fold pyridoxal phosphate-dependent enzyme [Muribaculaceae bacterium]|nr:aminotransferase class I/II-fold pyridoxal phosphate-dependent enzyme [Muribaculaceae bacterium]
MAERILLCLCHMSGREMDFINEAFADNWVVPLGPNVTGFEKDLEKFFFGSDNEHRIVALSSGTAAIHLALVALGVGQGDEVMVQSFTFSASANPVTYVGATPVFVDSEPETWNMDPELLDRAIAERIEKRGKKPKAIIPVYLYGMPAKIDEILAVAEKWGIPVVEDSAEAFGSKYNGKYCGTFGRFGIESFNGNKMITTSGGGALICPDETVAKLVTNYATQSREPAPWYQHERVGFNYRLSNICAGIGRGQMTVADEHLRHHRHVQQLYRELFADIPGVELHDNPSEKFDSNFWLCAITFSPEAKVKGDDGCGCPEAMRRAMEKENIETRHLWKPMHLQPFFSKSPAYVNGVSEDLFSRGLCLPAGPWVGEKEVERIVDTIKRNIC